MVVHLQTDIVSWGYLGRTTLDQRLERETQWVSRLASARLLRMSEIGW
jgi:hypothetical protein